MFDGRRFTVETKQQIYDGDQEIVSSAWIDETRFCLKMYDIMEMTKNDDGDCTKIENETF